MSSTFEFERCFCNDLLSIDTSAFHSGCMDTVKTPPIIPGKKSQSIKVGSCDHGPLQFTIHPSTDGYSLMVWTKTLIIYVSVRLEFGILRNTWLKNPNLYIISQIFIPIFSPFKSLNKCFHPQKVVILFNVINRLPIQIIRF